MCVCVCVSGAGGGGGQKEAVSNLAGLKLAKVCVCVWGGGGDKMRRLTTLPA